jgi:hypothetical protein
VSTPGFDIPEWLYDAPFSDIDILCHWLSPNTPSRVSSFGSLQHFRKSAKPAAAGDVTRCLDCPMEKDCAYSAKKSGWQSLLSPFCTY